MRRPFTAGAPASGNRILVQPFGGFGEYAQFDLVTGELHAAQASVSVPGGIYGRLGELPVVFYRGNHGLALRLTDESVELDGSAAAVTWQELADGRTSFAVTVGKMVACDTRYRSVAAEFDLGRLIRDVCADPDRRALIFPR